MEAMIAEVLVDDLLQYVCHKQGKDIFQKLAERVSEDFKRRSIDLSAEQILESFHAQKTGTLSFVVGTHTIIWHFTHRDALPVAGGPEMETFKA